MEEFDYDKGILKFSRDRVKKTTYVVANKNDFDVDLFLEHPRKYGHKLIETAAADQTTDHFYRFRIKVPSADVVKFVVAESILELETHNVNDVTSQEVKAWKKKNYISNEMAKGLKRVVGFNKRLEKLRFQKQQLQTKIDDLNGDVNRIQYILSALESGGKNILGLGGPSKGRSFFTGELQATFKQLRPKQQEMENLDHDIKDLEEEKKAPFVRMLKYRAEIDLATGKAEQKECMVPKLAREKDTEGKGKGKGKGTKRKKGGKKEKDKDKEKEKEKDKEEDKEKNKDKDQDGKGDSGEKKED